MGVFNPDGTPNTTPSRDTSRLSGSRTKSVSEWNTIANDYMDKFNRNQAITNYQNIQSLPTNQQYETINTMRQYNYINDAQKTDLEKAIAFNAERIKQSQKSNITKIKEAITNIPTELKQAAAGVITGNWATGGQPMTLGPKPQPAFDINKVKNDVNNFKVNANLYVQGYNTMNEDGQRSVRNNLTNVVKDYSNSSDKALRDTAAQAQFMLLYLSNGKKGLQQSGLDKVLNFNLDNLIDVKNKTTPIGLAKDFGAGAVNQLKDFGNVISDSLKTDINQLWYQSNRNVPGVKEGIKQPFLTDRFTNNWDAYQSGKISKQQYEVNYNRINDWFTRSIGTDTSLKNRLAKSAGWGAFGATFVLPTTGFLSGGQFILKEFLGDVLANGLMNSAATLKDYSKDKPIGWKDVALNFGTGALMASIPYVFTGAKNALVAAKAGRKLNSATGQLLEGIDNASTQQAANEEVVRLLNEADPVVREDALKVIKESLTPEEYTKLRLDIENALKATKELNNAVGTDIVPAETTTPNLAYLTDTTATTVPTTEVLPSELLAKKELTLVDTNIKSGTNKVFNIIDKDGKVLAKIKETDMPSANARLQEIRSNPTKYSTTYKDLFEPAKIKREVTSTGIVTREVKAPAFIKEGYTVVQNVGADNKVISYLLRDAQGKDIRTLRPAEITAYKSYIASRATAARLAESTTKLEAAAVRTRATTPTEAPTITSFGKKIQLTPENGWQAVKTADGGTIYTKVNKVGSNIKGDKTFINLWYDATGTKLTAEQAKAMIEGRMKTPVAKAVAMPEVKAPTPTEAPKAVVQPAKAPVTEKAPVGVAKPQEKITKGALRNIVSDIQRGFRDRLPEKDLATFATEQGNLAKYSEKYLKDWQERPQYVKDVISGKIAPTGKFQQEIYTLIVENQLQKGSAEDWFRISNEINLPNAQAYTKASETGQLLSVFSYFANKFDVNAVIGGLEQARTKVFTKLLEAKGLKLSEEVGKARATIEKATPQIANADITDLVKSYNLGKTNPLLKAFADGELKISELIKMTPDERLATLQDVVGKDLGLKFASDFEKKLLLKNQKIGLLNWIKTAKNVDPAIRKDIVEQIIGLSNVLDEKNAGRFDNLINTSLGIRLTKKDQINIFNLQKNMLEKRAATIAKYGSEQAWLDAASKRTWARTPEDIQYGLAQSDLNLYLKGTQARNWQQVLEEIKAVKKVNPLSLSIKLNDLARGLQSSIDNSFLGRQGSQVMKTDPMQWLKGAKNSYESFAKAFKNPREAERAFGAYILGDPWAEVAAKNGLAIMTKDDIFAASGPEKIPILGRAYKGSELAYDMAGQTMRLELFKKYYTADMMRMARLSEKAKTKFGPESEFTNIEMPKDYPKNLAKYINAITGRGDLGKFENAAGPLNLAFYSARFIKSQVDKLTMPFGVGIGGATYKTNLITHWNPVQRRAMFNLLKVISTTASMMAMANALKPGSAELDPRSADFGKIKIGDTRFDLTGGLGSFITLGSRTLPALVGQGIYTKNSNTGLVSKLNSGEYGSKTGFDVVLDFFTNKTSPVMTQVINKLKGQDINRMQPSVKDTLIKLITPMTVQNFRELQANPNAANKFWSAVFDFNGLSANTYAAAGAGSQGASWETSNAKDILAFRDKVGQEEFKKAAKKADDRFNIMMNKIRNSDQYKNSSPDFKRTYIRMAQAEIQKRIFDEYGFKYKAETMSATERQVYKNLINQNL